MYKLANAVSFFFLTIVLTFLYIFSHPPFLNEAQARC